MKKEILILAGIIVSILIFGVLVMAATQQTTQATVSVNTFLSVTLSNAPVTFPNMDPGTTKNATISYGFPLTAIIGAESNVNAKVETKGADFTGPASLAVSNMQWTKDISGTPTWTAYTTSDGAIVCTPVTPGNACSIYHQLTIPSAQKAGNYSTGITITATTAA